jgi:hypothetical protein
MEQVMDQVMQEKMQQVNDKLNQLIYSDKTDTPKANPLGKPKKIKPIKYTIGTSYFDDDTRQDGRGNSSYHKKYVNKYGDKYNKYSELKSIPSQNRGDSYRENHTENSYRENSYRENYTDDRRTTAFALLTNKDEIAKNMLRTRACSNVVGKEDENHEVSQFGVCTRSVCNFAHSLDELKLPSCHFDLSCRTRNGKRLYDGSCDYEKICQFKHSDENMDGWLKRTGKTLPNLPQTSVDSRKPELEKVSQTLEDSQSTSQVIDSNSSVSWDTNRLALVKQVKENLPTPIPSSSNIDENLHIIRVPTKELAHVALTVSFASNIHNIKIIVEDI